MKLLEFPDGTIRHMAYSRQAVGIGRRNDVSLVLIAGVFSLGSVAVSPSGAD